MGVRFKLVWSAGDGGLANGVRPWSAERELEQLIEPVPASLQIERTLDPMQLAPWVEKCGAAWIAALRSR